MLRRHKLIDDAMFLLIVGWVLLLGRPASAQDAAPNDATTKACDQAAANPIDPQRPPEIAGIAHVDAETAVPACEAAARATPQDPRMLYQLGRAYNAAKRAPEAANYYQQAAAAGYAMAAYQLSLMFEKGRGVAVDQDKQLAYLQQAAQAGLGIAEYKVGTYYSIGKDGLPKDESLAKQWFYSSADHGYFLGKYRYGDIRQRESSQPDDVAQASAWLENAVEQATPNDLFELCKSLELGTDGLQDRTAARELCRRSALTGHANAMFSYGFFLEHGLGGPQDDAEARQWYEKAALAGRANAMNSIGVFLENGRGGPKDLVEARKWFEKSANGNDPDGTNSLGLMFERGWGGPPDKAEARRLYQKAIDLGEKRFAANNLKRLDATP